MKISINANLKELDDDNVTISALIVTLNLTVKRLAVNVVGQSDLGAPIHPTLNLTNSISLATGHIS